ncbi:pentapeptide repeat-containing protein [Streptomyces sp. MK37H]|uniref:pentapeptide repeat-containing protein n=1 Tax=Streptomyces sp. MK37H TaxID=2699117 RepID=UPI0035A90003
MLGGARLSGARLTSARLGGARLRSARLRSARLRSARLRSGRGQPVPGGGAGPSAPPPGRFRRLRRFRLLGVVGHGLAPFRIWAVSGPALRRRLVMEVRGWGPGRLRSPDCFRSGLGRPPRRRPTPWPHGAVPADPASGAP